MNTVTQWLLLLAMMLTPLAMRPAAAASSPGHHAMATAGTSHCDPATPSKAHLPGDCSMACAGALPAAAAPAFEQPTLPVLPSEDMPVMHLLGLTPESATPPPRHG